MREGKGEGGRARTGQRQKQRVIFWQTVKGRLVVTVMGHLAVGLNAVSYPPAR